MKKKNVGVIASLIAMKSKVFGASMPPISVALYGPPRPSILELGLKVFQTVIAPILFLIGIIIYLKKSKSSKRRKVITTIILIMLLVGIYFGIEFLMALPYMVL